MSERVRNTCPAELHIDGPDNPIFYCVLNPPHDVHEDAYGHRWKGTRGLILKDTSTAEEEKP